MLKEGERISVQIRSIENGYLVSHSKRGGYDDQSSGETYFEDFDQALQSLEDAAVSATKLEIDSKGENF